MFQQMSRGARREFPTPGRCDLSLPGGFLQDAYNSKGEVKPWHVLTMVDTGRTLAFVPGTDGKSFLDFDKLFQDYYIFIGSVRLHISPEMYNVNIPKGPIRMHKELLCVSNSTSTIRTSIYNGETDCLFAQCFQQSVSVGQQTRKPAAFPDWWRKKYSPLCAGEAMRIIRAQRPDQSAIHTYPMLVQASDTDPYFHLNWSAYLKMILDAFALSTFSRNKSVNHSELTRPISCVELAYLRECNLGDRLTVNFWPDEDSSDKTNFEILNEDGKPSLHSSVEYFPDKSY